MNLVQAFITGIISVIIYIVMFALGRYIMEVAYFHLSDYIFYDTSAQIFFMVMTFMIIFGLVGAAVGHVTSEMWEERTL